MTIEPEWPEDHSINTLGPNQHPWATPLVRIDISWALLKPIPQLTAVLRQSSEHVVTGGRVLRTPSCAFRTCVTSTILQQATIDPEQAKNYLYVLNLELIIARDPMRGFDS